MAVPNWKLPGIVENNGAVSVGEESCVGAHGTRNLVDASGKTVGELMEAIVERYLRADCAIVTPHPDRLHHIEEMVGAYKAEGCSTTNCSSARPICWNRSRSPRRSRKERSPGYGSRPITA